MNHLSLSNWAILPGSFVLWKEQRFECHSSLACFFLSIFAAIISSSLYFKENIILLQRFCTRDTNSISPVQLAHSNPFIPSVFTLFTAEFEYFIEGINQMLVCCFIRWLAFYSVGINSLWSHKTVWLSVWPLALLEFMYVCLCVYSLKLCQCLWWTRVQRVGLSLLSTSLFPACTSKVATGKKLDFSCWPMAQIGIVAKCETKKTLERKKKSEKGHCAHCGALGRLECGETQYYQLFPEWHSPILKKINTEGLYSLVVLWELLKNMETAHVQ